MITLRLDKNGGINKGDIKAFEHDNLSEVYIIQLYKNGAIYDLTNKSIELTMVERKRKIGDMVSLPIYEATEGKVKLEVVSDITKQDGIYDFKLTVKDTTGLIETFPNFQVGIKNDITDSITGEIIQDPNFTILTEGLKALADYNIYKTNALKVPEIEQDIVEINEQLDKIDIKKANEVDLIVERERINNLSALGEGSTTGDAELIDIRVGADGVTYDNAGSSVRSQFLKVNTHQKITFNMGLPDGTGKEVRASSNVLYLKEGDLIETKSPYVLSVFYFDSDFKNAQLSQQINVVSEWKEKITITRTGYCVILAKRNESSDEHFSSTEYLSSNTILTTINSNTTQEKESYKVNYVYGHNDRTTGQFLFNKNLITSDCFYELNGDILSIVSEVEFFVILFDQNLKIVADSFAINGDKYVTKWIKDVKSNYPNAKYIRIVTQVTNGLNTLTKIATGIKKPTYNENILLSASNSTFGNKLMSDFVCNGTDDREIIQQALWLSYSRNCKVKLFEGDYILNSLSSYDNAPEKTCLWFDSVPNEYQYANNVKMFSLEGVNQGISFTSGTRIILGDALYNSITNETVTMIRGKYQATYDVVEGVSAIRMRNLTWILPNNQKAITCVDLGYTHACDLDDVKCIAVKPEDGYGHLKTPPIANSKCYGIRGLFGSNWNVVNTFKNIEVFGFYIGFDISGEHCSVINASAKYNYYGFTFCHLQRYGANHHPITCINMLDEHSVCMPLFGKETEQWINQGIIIYGYNLMFPSWCTQGDITAEDERHHKARELGSENGFGGVIYYSNNTTRDGSIAGNQYYPAFFEQGGKAIKCVNMAHKLAHSTMGRSQLEPNYMEEVFDITLNKKVIWDGTKWIDVNGNPVD